MDNLITTLVAYYVNLLIIQYAGKARARETIAAQTLPALMPTYVQYLQYVAPPTSGNYKLSYNGFETDFILWDYTATQIQSRINFLPDLVDAVRVFGNAEEGFLIYFSVTPTQVLGVVEDNVPINTGTPTVTDQSVPLLTAIENAFNPSNATGVQLDIIGKYVGVTRRAQGFTGPITLGDSDFRSLIYMAILTNSAQSDLASIQEIIFAFFAGEIRVYDYQNMRMSYLISTSVGSIQLVEMFIAQGLLPRPMAVQVAAVVYAPDITNFFGFSLYGLPVPSDIRPFNTYQDYEPWPWLDYQNAVYF